MIASTALRPSRGKTRRQRELEHARDMRRVRYMNARHFQRTVKTIEQLNRMFGEKK